MGLRQIAKDFARHIGLTDAKPRPGESAEAFRRRQDAENSATASVTGATVGGSVDGGGGGAGN